MATASVGRPVRRARMFGVTVIAAVVLAAGMGAVVTMADLGIGARSSSSAPNQINDDVKTSFGIVAVAYVRQVDGLTHRALAGSVHGVKGLVDASHAQIQVAVSITNRVEHPISYTSDQFRLLVTTGGKTTVQKVRGGNLPNARVLPDAGIQGHLDFTVPRSDAHLALRFRDPGSTNPILIDLGNSSFAQRQGDSGHSQH